MQIGAKITVICVYLLHLRANRRARERLMSEIDAYDYDLPEGRIAQHPLRNRADARLLIVDRASQSLEHAHVRDLPELLAPGDAVVLNDTRVVPAQLAGRRTNTGGRWSGLFVTADEHGVWQLLCTTRGKLQPGETVTLEDRLAREDVRLKMLTRLDRGLWAARPESNEGTLAILERVGRVPLPHYIRDGKMVDADRENYQTVFAAKPGAVAAPTAGLHFTRRLIDELTQRGVEVCFVTLHVGLGTFRPITTESLSEHEMHTEWSQISRETVDRLVACRDGGGRIVAVGTTAVRTLETAAASGRIEPFGGHTGLFIRPPYRFQAVDVLMTNFHLPRTTLLVLVRTFGGDDLIMRAYREAIRQEYRFYSYGDAMLIF
jgi:S-adenosylmethionine:tRNA ribosyltransferase-isomerase